MFSKNTSFKKKDKHIHLKNHNLFDTHSNTVRQKSNAEKRKRHKHEISYAHAHSSRRTALSRPQIIYATYKIF